MKSVPKIVSQSWNCCARPDSRWQLFPVHFATSLTASWSQFSLRDWWSLIWAHFKSASSLLSGLCFTSQPAYSFSICLGGLTSESRLFFLLSSQELHSSLLDPQRCWISQTHFSWWVLARRSSVSLQLSWWSRVYRKWLSLQSRSTQDKSVT